MGRRRSLTLRRRLYHAGASALVWLSALLCCALLLFLVFPVKAAFVLLAAAAIGALVPVPKGWLER